MGCNCGDNEYNITVNNNGNCEPTTPIYNITLANVGVNGYSPIVRFINETVESFNIAVDNVTGTETSPAVPKLSYVADQINNVNNTIANLGNTYLTRDGSNAASSVKFNNIQFSYVGATRQTIRAINSQELLVAGQGLYLQGHASQAQAYPNTISIAPQGTSVTIGNANRHTIIVNNDGASYDGNEIATVNQIPSITGKLNTDGSNATNTFTVNGVELASNYVYINSVSSGGISVTQSNSDIYANLGVDSNKAYLSVPSFTLNASPYPNSKTVINCSGNFRINGQGSKFYYGSSETANNEVAIKGDIPTAGNGIDITNNVISVDESDLDFLKNTATGTASLTIEGNPSDEPYTVNIGNNSYANYAGSVVIGYSALSNGYNNIAIGNSAKCNYGGDNNIAIGADAYVGDDTISVNNSYQIGTGTNLTSNSLAVGYRDDNLITHNYQLLDLTTGKIPNDRINTMIGATTLTGGSAGLVPAPSVGDENKFLKADGTWDTVGGGGGSSYTAGTGIDITNDTISVNSSVVLTSGNQTISGLKTFEYIKFTNSLMTPIDNIDRIVLAVDDGTLYVGTRFTNLYLAGLGTRPHYNNSEYLALYSDIPTVPTNISAFNNDSGYITGITSSDVITALGYTPYNSTNPDGFITSADLPTNYVTIDTAQTITGIKTFNGNIKTDIVYNTNNNPILQIYNSTIRVGNSNYGLKLLGNSTRPEYSIDGGTNYNQLALLSDIPTVNDSTITFTQGGVTKGTITLNQSGDATIALDAGSAPSVIDGGNA